MLALAIVTTPVQPRLLRGEGSSLLFGGSLGLDYHPGEIEDI
jgi:hypothetical protein